MNQRLDRLKTFWLVETLEHTERIGYLEDNDVLTILASDLALQTSSDQELIIRRTEELANRHSKAREIKENINNLISSASTFLAISCLISMIAGISTASAIFNSSSSINIVIAWTGFVGLNILSLLITIFFTLSTSTSLHLSLPKTWLWILGHIGKKYSTTKLLQSLGTLIGRTGKIGYFLSNISHLLWIFFTIGTLLGCLFFLLFRQYSFVWETTILSANFFVWFTGFVGSFPCITDFYAPCPSAADITSLADQDETRKAWTKWLLGSIVVYGLMPRILAFFVSLNISKRTIDRLVIESTNPFYNLLAKRLRDRISLYEEIIDPDPGNVTPTGNLKSKTDQFLPTKNIGMIIPFEVRNLPDIDLAPCDTKPIQATNVRTHIEKQHALQLLAKSSVSNLLIIADAGVTADRGAFHFIHQAMGNAANIRVALLQQNDARQDKVENWLEGLNEIGINRQSIFSHMEPALCWLLNKTVKTI